MSHRRKSRPGVVDEELDVCPSPTGSASGAFQQLGQGLSIVVKGNGCSELEQVDNFCYESPTAGLLSCHASGVSRLILLNVLVVSALAVFMVDKELRHQHVSIKELKGQMLGLRDELAVARKEMELKHVDATWSTQVGHKLHANMADDNPYDLSFPSLQVVELIPEAQKVVSQLRALGGQVLKNNQQLKVLRQKLKELAATAGEEAHKKRLLELAKAIELQLH